MHEPSAEKSREIQTPSRESIVLFFSFFNFKHRRENQIISRAMRFVAISAVGIVNRAARRKGGANDEFFDFVEESETCPRNTETETRTQCCQDKYRFLYRLLCLTLFRSVEQTRTTFPLNASINIKRVIFNSRAIDKVNRVYVCFLPLSYRGWNSLSRTYILLEGRRPERFTC